MRKSLIIAALLMASCTHLETKQIRPGESLVVGLPYALSQLHYQVTIAREIVDCSGSPARSQPVFAFEANAKPVYNAGERFLIDPSHLAGWTKTTSLKLENYQNGTIKSINAAAVDHGPEIVAGVVKTGFAIARLAMGLPTVSSAEGGGGLPKPQAVASSLFTCPETDLKIVDHDNSFIKKQVGILTGIGEELETLRSAAIISGLTDVDRARLLKLTAATHAVNIKIGDATADRDRHRARLRFVETLSITPRTGTIDDALVFPSSTATTAELETKWLSQFYATVFFRSPGYSELGRVLTLTWVEIVADGAPIDQQTKSARNPPANRFKAAPQGFTYRLAATATLKLCALAATADCLILPDEQSLFITTDAAPQFGPMVILPLKNGFGQDSELSASFGEDGALIKAEYQQRKVVLQQAIAAVDAGLDSGTAFAADKRKADDAAAAAPGKAVDAEIASLKQQHDLAAAKAAMDPANLAKASQLADLQTQLAQLTAVKAIKDIQAQIDKGNQ